MVAEAREEVAQVGEGIEGQSFGGGDQAGQHGGGAASLVAAVEHPVLAAYRNAAQAALGRVVINFQIAVFAVAG